MLLIVNVLKLSVVLVKIYKNNLVCVIFGVGVGVGVIIEITIIGINVIGINVIIIIDIVIDIDRFICSIISIFLMS